MEMRGSSFDRASVGDFKVSIAKYVILSIVTFGIFNIYWQWRQMSFVNTIGGEEKFSFLKWSIFTIITCGIYHIYYEYVMAREITILQEKFGLSKSGDLPSISIILSILGYVIPGLILVVDAIQQREINMMVNKVSAKPV